MNAPTDAEWRQRLSPDQYHVLREKGTEAPFSGKYVGMHDDGMYHCAACGQALFSSRAKFASGTGWPSFDDPVNAEHVELKEDRSGGMMRTEVVCKNCGGHLGHLFMDGPTKNSCRYCINSAALEFRPKDENA